MAGVLAAPTCCRFLSQAACAALMQLHCCRLRAQAVRAPNAAAATGPCQIQVQAWISPGSSPGDVGQQIGTRSLLPRQPRQE
jgi:hypothetical protein